MTSKRFHDERSARWARRRQTRGIWAIKPPHARRDVKGLQLAIRRAPRETLLGHCHVNFGWTRLEAGMAPPVAHHVACRARAAILATRSSRSAMRRSRHWPRSTPISISTMLSQLTCLGV
jgi:hypothetical protein